MKFWNLWDKYGTLGLTFIIFIIFAGLSPGILKPINIINLLNQSSVIAIAAAGMTLAITVGGFDLSVGSILALTTVVVGKMVPIYGIAIAITIAIIVAVFCGLINGFLITKVKIQTFVATLATMIIFQGIALIWSDARIVSILKFPDVKIFTIGRLLGIPIPIIMIAVAYALIYLIYKFTRLGVYIRGIGSNIYSARVSGIAVDAVIIAVFIITAVTAALSGIITVSQLLIGNATYGATFALEVITVTILGGTSLVGGKGSLWGTLIAALMIGLMKNGLNFLNVSSYIQNIFIGALLLISLSIGSLKVFIFSKYKDSE
jgi:ribose transport system permease protein